MDILNYLRRLFFIEEKKKTEDIFFECEESEDIVVGQTDDCDFCTMVGVDICCLHRMGKTFGMAALSRTTTVNSDKKRIYIIFNYDGYSFTGVFSKTSNRWVLVYGDGDGSYDDEEDDLHLQRMYKMYLNMNKAVKGNRRTFAEYKALVVSYD